MLYLPLLISIVEVLIVTVPVLLTVAFVTVAERKTMASMQRRLGPNIVGYYGLLQVFADALKFLLKKYVSPTQANSILFFLVTVAERKTMASMQRRLGPNIVGYYGLLQAFADALKLLLKEYVSPTQANLILFFLGPIITLIFSLLGFSVVPYGPGLAISDFNLGILYMLAVSSLSTYGILLAGWSANSKYAFLGSLRSTAQLISYETVNIESQKAVWYIIPLLPIFIIFFIGSIAETNRAPFDLAEAESELVSGFMTEHAAVIFVFFFLAEYASIVLICILTTILFLGGYIINYLYVNIINSGYETLLSDPIIEGMVYGLTLGLKSCIMIFIFIWARASFPRIRYDQLMSFCWTILLPLVLAFIFLFPCILISFDLIPSNVHLL
uniref:NADH-ubiquinone oxidoreductase chain 1 n=1 Tax=Cladonia rangiferina TaxID=111670 RepID=A0A2D1P9S0_9LECA|nr:NADH dehydrogenase subunit 1 [Cladonia rangiferina]ATO89303.1 NADH dehydrogenase subunit 1 [Cladonia rangiferina]